MRAWRVRDISTLFSHRIFRLERHAVEAGSDLREAMVLRAPDWVNVIARDEEGGVLLVRQWRYGIAAADPRDPGRHDRRGGKATSKPGSASSTRRPDTAPPAGRGWARSIPTRLFSPTAAAPGSPTA
jgi:hypothetical protein